jgi:hypothetical protein
MQLETVQYHLGSGWSGPLPVALDSPSTLVLAFGARRLADDPAPFKALIDAFPNSVLIGCSTAGEIAGDSVSDDSVTVAVARFQYTRLRLACAEIGHADQSEASGRALGAELAANDLRAVFLLSDGLHVNGTLLTQGLNAAVASSVVVSGGLAGDNDRFEKTWIMARGELADQRVCALGLYGDALQVGYGCEGGWSSFGPERRITRAAGNVLYQLDDKPALDLYKEYLGQRAADLPAAALLFPLSVKRGVAAESGVVRTILGIDEASKSMTFAGDIPEHGTARLMRANNGRLIESASAAARQAMLGVAASQALVISVSCVGRRLVLGEHTDEELEAVGDVLPKAAVQIGFYSYGEISPAQPSGISALHNQTMTVTIFSEMPPP